MANSKFLKQYGFDEGFEEGESVASMIIRALEGRQRIDTFLRSQYGRGFSLAELIQYTGADRQMALRYLRNRDDVEAALITKAGSVFRWVSHVEPFESTEEGELEEKLLQAQWLDQLGRDARADFLWTQTRGRHKRRVSSRQ